MVDTDDTRRTTDNGRRTTPWVWHKLPTGELKNRSSVCLTAKANGIKLKPFIVFKGKRIDPVLAGIPGICVAYSANGWMNNNLTIEWLQKIWGVFAFGKRLLVWDSY